ncbi:MAG: LptA/OstA family protein [Thermodesulfobacteriota bacterium]
MKSAIAWLCASIFCLGLLATASARSQGDSLLKDSDQPINITSREATTGTIPEGIKTRFVGAVRATQGDLTLTCELMELIFNDPNPKAGPKDKGRKFSAGTPRVSDVKSITATGNVKLVYKETMATAGKALYDRGKRTITLTEGPPRFWKGSDMGIADMIIIYLDENKAELKSGKDQRIDITISGGEPKKEK